MNYATIIIETLLMTIAFTAMILVPLIKNPVWWIHDFPADIQEEYFKTHERIPTALSQVWQLRGFTAGLYNI